jgi:hypothetical protein
MARQVRIPGLPDFNAGDSSLIVRDVDGYMDGSAPTPVLVANGGGPGAVAVGDWESAEDYLTVEGLIFAAPESLTEFHRALLAAFSGDRESSLVIVGNGVDVDKQVFARLYDRRTINQLDDRLAFSLPLVAPDPLKYALEPVGGDMGVFTGQTWFRTYTETSPARWTRTYTLSGGRWVRTYQQAVPSGPYPLSLALFSDGDAASSRVEVTVNGPVTAGDWWLINETTGERLWAELSVAAGQQLVFDMATRTARLNGAPVDHLVFGDWLTLAAGQNLFRLVSGTQSDAFASVSALPAYL